MVGSSRSANNGWKFKVGRSELEVQGRGSGSKIRVGGSGLEVRVGPTGLEIHVHGLEIHRLEFHGSEVWGWF